ncbi:MAG: alpha/beta hydrolase [Acidobacteriaceae bacterium]
MRQRRWACRGLMLCAALGCGGALALAQSSAPNAGKAEASQDMLSRKEVTGIIADSRKIVTSNGVEALLTVPVNGENQWLSIRGRDRRNPILLVLHGGPGSPTMPADYTFQSPWEDYFTVVEWDQRGAGKTYASNDTKALASTLTVEQMTSDAEVVVRYLMKTYGKKKIFLLGHSWGSVLGVELAQRHPEWFYAYLGVGQVVNMQKSERIGYEFALQQAKEHGNSEAVKELMAIAPYPGPEGSVTFARIGVQRKWLMYYGGLTWGRKDYDYDSNARELSPDYTQKDIDETDKGGLASVTHLLPALMAIDFDSVDTFKCPVFLFDGRHDYATSHELAVGWFKKIKAPEKEFVWFDHSSHMAMQEEPGRFLYYMVRDMRPLAVATGDMTPDNEVLH